MCNISAKLRFLKTLGIPYRDEWEIAIREKQNTSLFEGNTKEFFVIRNSQRYWAADPFIFKYNGRNYLFAELFDRFEDKGVLGVAKIVNGRVKQFKVFMRQPWHLSYPCVWEDNGHIYLMPESYQAKKVFLYEAVRFPMEWRLIKEIVSEEYALVDTTPIKLESSVHFYTTKARLPGEPRMDSLYEIIQDNTLQMIIEKSLQVRPAGGFFKSKDVWIRPSQNGTKTYGGHLLFNWVDSFYPYAEHVVKEVYPPKSDEFSDGENHLCVKLKNPKSKKYCGLHTYNSNEDYEVIDLKYRGRFNIVTFRKELCNYLKKKFGKEK